MGDAQNAVDLNEEALEEAEVTAGQARDGGCRLGIGELVGVELLAEAPPMMGEDEVELVIWTGLKASKAVISMRICPLLMVIDA